MSLQTRLEALVAAIGTDIKQLKQSGSALRAGNSTANQTISGADTYLAGSALSIPDNCLQVGTIYKLRFNATKTAAGTATPAVNIRIGTAGTIADNSPSFVSYAAQTAVADEAAFEVRVVFRAVGASAIIQTFGTLEHRLSTTGFSTSVTSVSSFTSAAFNATASGLKIGASVNPGTSAVWTINFVSAELVGLQTLNPAGILFVNSLSEVPAGTPANTLVVLKGA